MEAEYYIPKEEDLFLGYEAQVYESFPQYNERNIVTHYEWEWHHTILDSGYKLNYWRNKIVDEHLRVAYLTREQIEAEGWTEIASRVFTKEGGDTLGYARPPGSFGMMWIRSIHVRYDGVCPSINEFRKIIKLLNIEDTKAAKASDGETTGEK